MDRRDFLAATAATLLLPAARALAATGDLKGAAREAWLYALPLIEMANTRQAQFADRAANKISHVRTLADPSKRQVTAPNNDTLYSSAWFDLTQGPVTLNVPDAGNRYCAVQLMDMYTNTNACISKRTFDAQIGPSGGTFTLIGPGQPARGPNPIHLATPHGWLLARILTDGDDDLPATHALQDRLTLTGPAIPIPGGFARRSAAATDYFASAARLLRSDPPPAADHAELARFAVLGLQPGKPFEPGRLSTATMAEIEAGITEARGQLVALAKSASFVGGWSYPKADLGNFGQDHLYRAIVALVGLAANTPDEAMYLAPQGDNGRLFTGDGLYRMHLPAPPPVDAFWSLTMYEATSEGQLYLTANPLGRYSIGNRTKGLTYGADGSLDIWISRTDPVGDRSANWLPAPASGPFSLSFRAYWPRPEFRDGRYRLPPIERH
ncbi:DUF1254 domain-containing protein [Novosphingobium sp. PASSN1]|uniref:DUF1254 domain-containing protein n=1 Tax=Novosphingobium sp. PASSN1 TaxID=2015561 RepID=UPI000BC586E0|nr:DUF1254 domain-containing protein [Novosphingobium sp. PASSN1]OYU34333.1 MAG: phosphatidylserine decarboxylase [Novosphingobium sp. PASSN1]